MESEYEENYTQIPIWIPMENGEGYISARGGKQLQ